MAESEFSADHSKLLALEAAALADVEQYGVCSLADKARVQKLSLRIQDKLSQIRALTRDLELLVEELDSDEERQQVESLLAHHKVEYDRIQAAFKQAALAQRTAALRSAAEERRELLSGADAAARLRKLQTEADSVALAEDVTGGLRRTRQVLAEELEHTSATLAAMEASHASLAKTRDEYRGQHGQLKRSKGLLGTLNWQAKSETYMLWFGLTLFVLVCAYIFQKRAGHFIPDRLKPGSLLKAAGLTARSRPMPVPAPTQRLRPQAPPPRGRVPPPQQPQAAVEQQAAWEEEEVEPYMPAPPAPVPDKREAAPAHDQEQELPPYEPYDGVEVEHSVYGPASAVPQEAPPAMQDPAPDVQQEAAPVAAQAQEEPAQTEFKQQLEPVEQVEPEQQPEAAEVAMDGADADVEQLAAGTDPAAMPATQPAELQPEHSMPPEETAAEHQQGEAGEVQQEAAPQEPVRQEPASAAEASSVEQPPVATQAEVHEPPPSQQEAGSGAGGDPELLDALPQPDAVRGVPLEQAPDAAADEHEPAVWPEGAPEFDNTEPGSPAYAAAHAAAAAGDQQPADGRSNIIHDRQGRPIVVDRVEEYVRNPHKHAGAADQQQAAVGQPDEEQPPGEHPAEPAKPAPAAADGQAHDEL